VCLLIVCQCIQRRDARGGGGGEEEEEEGEGEVVPINRSLCQ